MRRPLSILILLLPVSTFAASVTDPALLGASDVIHWSQLGSPGSVVPSSFRAVSDNGITLTGDLGSGGGTIAQVCPTPDCDFTSEPPYFNTGVSLLWTENTQGNGTGPLLATFNTPVMGLSFDLQLTAPGSFTVSFIEIANGRDSTWSVTSDAAGDPLFVGALDPIADIKGFYVGIGSCTSSTPGICNPTDFVMSDLDLTPAPEPRTFLPLLVIALFAVWSLAAKRCLVNQLERLLRSCQAIAPCVASRLQLTKHLPALLLIGALCLQAQTPSLPLWHYQIASPVNNLTYRGYMVGSDPFERGARTTTIPVIIVPMIVNFQNTTTGFSATFDPSSNPDAACTAGQTVTSLVENSPLFVDNDWVLNEVDVGYTQYIDAYQRANFWDYVQNTGDAYHVLFNYTEGEPLTVNVSYATAGPAAGVAVNLTTSCTNPAQRGTTNPAGFEGSAADTILRPAMLNYIASHNITPAELPVFITYNVVVSENQTLTYGGYHYSTAGYPAALTSPGQTFILADFRTVRTGAQDVTILSHEFAEWMNDPGGYNFAPAWTYADSSTGCSQYLEVGDPLEGVLLPPMTGPNGFTYHVQELAFFSWYLRIPSFSAGALYSDNGTFTNNAGSVCQPNSGAGGELTTSLLVK